MTPISAPKPLEDAEANLLKAWLSIAESQICSLEVLSKQLPDVSARVEKDMTAISEQFVALAGGLQAQQKLTQQMQAQHKNLAMDELLELQKQSARMIQAIIVGMQFQDWTAQNLVIASNVIGANIEHLNKGVGVTNKHFGAEASNVGIDKNFAKELVEHFKLGELQRRFVDHLIEHQYIADPKEIDFSLEKTVEKKSGSEDNVDLF